jgi:hypothetical protein
VITVSRSRSPAELWKINPAAGHGHLMGTTKAMMMLLCGKGILRHVHKKNVVRDSKAHFILAFNPKNPK